jgi:hypothetical protein
MKRWRTTLIAVLVFAVILAYVLLVERDKAPPAEPGVTPSPTPVTLLRIAPQDLRAIQATDGSRTLRLAREGEEWQVDEGQGRRKAVDAVAVSMTADDLAGLQARSVVLDALTDAATYGLDPPALSLTLQTAGGGEVRLAAGREAPGGAAFYVQLDGDPRLYLVDHYRIEPFLRWLSEPPYAPTPASE